MHWTLTAREFMLKWTFVTKLTIRELTLTGARTLGEYRLVAMVTALHADSKRWSVGIPV